MNRSLEQRLIEKAARGDQVAAGKLIKAHQASLYAYILRLSGKPEMAEDIVQDAFVRVLTHLDRFDPKYRFSTWLFTIAKRLYVNANQKLQPRYDTEVVGAWRSDNDDSPHSPSLVEENRVHTRTALQDALNCLNEHQREIVVLFHQQGWPISQIAAHKDMPEGTVKSHLHRARQRMRRMLEQSDSHQFIVQETTR